MVSKRPLLLGAALLLLSLLLVLTSASLRGPLNPACSGARGYQEGCFALLPSLFLWAALPVALAGGILVAIWMGRRAAVEDPRDEPSAER